MSCLGERLTALVDGELDHDERDFALAHLARCQECRAEADLLRRLKGRLRGLATPPPEQAATQGPEGADGAAPDLPSVDFLTKLYALGEQPAEADRAAEPPRTPRAGSGRRAALPGKTARPRDNRPVGRAAFAGGLAGGTVAARRLPRRRYFAVGAAAVMVFGLGSASYAVGGESDQTPPPVTPAFDRLEAEHTLTNGVVPLSGTSSRP